MFNKKPTYDLGRGALAASRPSTHTRTLWTVTLALLDLLLSAGCVAMLVRAGFSEPYTAAAFAAAMLHISCRVAAMGAIAIAISSILDGREGNA